MKTKKVNDDEINTLKLKIDQTKPIEIGLDLTKDKYDNMFMTNIFDFKYIDNEKYYKR